MLIVRPGDVVNHQQQALRLVARSLVGLVVSCALVLQLLLIGLAYGSVAAAASSPDDPFVICYGNGGDGAADHGSDSKPVNSLHCLIICAQAHGSTAATLPAFTIILRSLQANDALGLSEAADVLPARLGIAHPSRGPPPSA